MKYSVWCIMFLLLVSGLLQGCSGAVKMEKVKVGQIVETREWIGADGKQRTETTIAHIYEDRKKTDTPEVKSDDFWPYYIMLMTSLQLLD